MKTMETKMAEIKIGNEFGELSTVEEFMEKYAKKYPKFNEEEFKDQLARMEEMLVF
jgi:hypothetical protein